MMWRAITIAGFMVVAGAGSVASAQSIPAKPAAAKPAPSVSASESEAALGPELIAQAAESLMRGNDLIDRDLFAEADPHYRNAAAIAVDGLGADHPTSLTLSGMVAVNLIAMGRLEEALGMLEPILDGLIAHYGEDSAEASRIRVVMSHAYLRTEDPVRAIPLMERVIQAEGPDAPRYVINLATMGQTLNRAGRHAEAEVWLSRALEREGAPGTEPSAMGAVRAHLAESMRRQGRLDEAEAMLRQSVDALEGRTSITPKEIERYWILGEIIAESGRAADSVDVYRTAMDAVSNRHSTDLRDQTRLGERRVFAPMYAAFVASAWAASTDGAVSRD